MNNLAVLICTVGLLSGCGQANFQTGSLAWEPGATNMALIVNGPGVKFSTNVTAIQDAENILGQYGWHLVSVSGGVHYLSRSYRGTNTVTFFFVPPPPSQN